MDNQTTRRFKGFLYWRDDEGEIGLIAEFDEKATCKEEAHRKVLDNYWDTRLDSASCQPYFIWK